MVCSNANAFAIFSSLVLVVSQPQGSLRIMALPLADPPTPSVTPEAVARHFLPTDGPSLQPATRRAVVEACNVFSVAATRHTNTDVWAQLRPSLSKFLGFAPPKLDGDAIAVIAAKRLKAEAEEKRDKAIEVARQMCDIRVGRIDAALHQAKDHGGVGGKGLDLAPEVREKLRAAAERIAVVGTLGGVFVDDSSGLLLSLTDAEYAEILRLQDLASQKVAGAKALIRHCVRAVDAAARGCFEDLEDSDIAREQLRKFRQSRIKRNYNFEETDPSGATVAPAGIGVMFVVKAIEDAAAESADELIPNYRVRTFDQLAHIDESSAKEEKAALAQLQAALDSKALAGAVSELDEEHFPVPADLAKAFLDCYTGFYETKKGLYIEPSLSRKEVRALFNDEV